MKTLKITLLTVILACMSVNNTNAQSSIGVNLGLYNSLEEGADSQFGFNLAGKLAISDQIRVGANIGYYFKSYEFGGRSFTMPITGLFEYSFNDEDFSPYAGIDLGIYRFGFSYDGNSDSQGYFGLAPVFGFNFSVADNLLLNFNAKYHYIMSEGESTSALGINAGVALTF